MLMYTNRKGWYLSTKDNQLIKYMYINDVDIVNVDC